ncbi:hypothetical protein B0H13DRAFT_1929615 [Mycena leptocephala]|nr:hypothetical protein B0H13DRAFT_1929615 [Mycena leptocephala]
MWANLCNKLWVATVSCVFTSTATTVVLIAGAEVPRCTARSVMVVQEDVQHCSRWGKLRSAARCPDVDIMGSQSAAAVPGISVRGAGFGLARMGVQDFLLADRLHSPGVTGVG